MKSAVRRCMMEKKVSEGLTDFSKYIDPVWTGRVAYRVLIPVERFPISVREDPNFVRPVKVSHDTLSLRTFTNALNCLFLNSTAARTRYALIIESWVLSEYECSLQHIVRYCIADGSMMNVVGFVSQPELAETLYDSPWSTKCETEEFINCYPEWEPEVLEMLKVCDGKTMFNPISLTLYSKLADKPMKLAIHDLRPLPVYVSGNVALVGDAVR